MRRSLNGEGLFGKIVGENYQIQQIIKDKEQRYLKAEIALLRSQVNPHFLFNVLNNIDEMIYEDRDKASLALHNMSSILRYSFKDSEGDKVPLESEIQFIRDYIHLMKTSFQDPNFIELKISGECSQGAIAPMVLIPFVENTLKHAKKQVLSPGIQIHIDCHAGELNLLTQYSIRKTDSKAAYKPGFGLQNVMKRLELIYPEKHKLSISEENGLFTVNLKILTS